MIVIMRYTVDFSLDTMKLIDEDQKNEFDS